MQGAGSSVTLVRPGSSSARSGFDVRETELQAAAAVPGVHVTFSSQTKESDVLLELQVKGNGKDNQLTITAYGQVVQYF